MIKCIVFDIGGVLIPECSNLIKEEIAVFLGVSSLNLSKLLHNEETKILTGEISLFQMYSDLIKKIGSEIDPKKILAKHISSYIENSRPINKSILLLIEKLKRKYIVVCLTNTESEVMKVNNKLGLFDYFDRAYISTKMKLKKPQAEIYESIINDLGYSPSELLFIDDKFEHVLGAQQSGLNTIHYINYKQLVGELKSYVKLSDCK